MKTGSVCTGYAGLDRAVHEVLGGELAWVADIDPGASAILAHRLPSVPNLGDISKTNWAVVKPVDVLTAGFPCQDVSCAGGRAGLREGNRTGVWAYVARAIDELRPALVVLENVRGLLTFGADSDLEPCPWCMGDSGDESALRACGAVLADLADLGFDAEWMLVPAAKVGAPHRRERVFILAWPAADTAPASGRRGSIGGSAEQARQPREPRRFLSEPDDGCLAAEDTNRTAGGEWRIAAPGEAESGRPWADTSGRDRAPAPDAASTRPARRQDIRAGGSDAGARSGNTEPQRGGAERGSAAAVAGSSRLRQHPGEPLAEEAGTLAGNEPADSRGLRPAANWGPYALAILRWERVLGRPSPRPTEPGRTGERLSPRFVEWMMGLPEGWVTDVPGLSRNAQLKALGNGVVPQQAALALRLLLERAGLSPLTADRGAA